MFKSLVLSVGMLASLSHAAALEVEKSPYQVDTQKRSYLLDVHHPNHAVCHIQIIARSPNGTPVALDPSKFEMVSKKPNINHVVYEHMPFLKNLHGIETNVGSAWLYVKSFTFNVKDGRSFAQVLGADTNLYAIQIPCAIPDEFKLTH